MSDEFKFSSDFGRFFFHSEIEFEIESKSWSFFYTPKLTSKCDSFFIDQKSRIFRLAVNLVCAGWYEWSMQIKMRFITMTQKFHTCTNTPIFDRIFREEFVQTDA